MTIVAWALAIAALGANVLAIRALFARDRFAIWKRRCLVAAALLVCAIVIASTINFIVMDPPPAMPMASDKARRLAEAISEFINGTVFVVLVATLPLVAGFVLRGRERRASR